MSEETCARRPQARHMRAGGRCVREADAWHMLRTRLEASASGRQHIRRHMPPAAHASTLVSPAHATTLVSPAHATTLVTPAHATTPLPL